MGCVQLKLSQIKKIKIYKSQKNCMTEKSQNIQNKQDLNISDYEAFIKKTKQQGKIDYPCAFQYINISNISNQQLLTIPKQNIFALNCTRRQLIRLSVQMITENSFSKQKLDKNNVEELITEIANNYNTVSYHNFTHGFSLMQMIYKCFKIEQKFLKIYSEEDLTYYLIAGITHDVNHRKKLYLNIGGTNNGFEVKLNSQLAKIAQNEGVLQKMHLRTFLNIIRKKPQIDVISKASNPLLTKQKITRVILATDIAKHFNNLNKIQKYNTENTLNFNDEQIKIQFIQNLVHACDIGNALLSTQQYLTWSSLLTYQFNEQTKIQAEKNVPVTQFLRFKGISSFYDDQVGFLSTFVIPLWKQINLSFPALKQMVDNSQKNLTKIKQLKQKQKK